MRRPSPALIVAIAALIVALSGTAIAASHYLITSTSQIKPSVVKELQRPAIAAAAKLAAKGAHAIVAEARSSSSVAVHAGEANVPLTGATWTQKAEEDETFLASATITTPKFGTCNEPAEVVVDVDGGESGGAVRLGTTGTTETVQIGNWEFAPGDGWGLLQAGHPVNHTVGVRLLANCGEGAGSYTVQQASVDVIGVH